MARLVTETLLFYGFKERIVHISKITHWRKWTRRKDKVIFYINDLVRKKILGTEKAVAKLTIATCHSHVNTFNKVINTREKQLLNIKRILELQFKKVTFWLSCLTIRLH